MKLLGRIIAVKHLNPSPVKSSLIEIPDSVTDSPHTTAVEAKVTHVGSKSCYKNIVTVGSKVLVPFHLGTRKTVEGQALIIYDDEDVLAAITS